MYNMTSVNPENHQELRSSWLKVSTVISFLQRLRSTLSGNDPADTDPQVDQGRNDVEAQNVAIVDHDSVHLEADTLPFNSDHHHHHPGFSSSSSTPDSDRKKETATVLEPLPREGPLMEDFNFPPFPTTLRNELISDPPFYWPGESSRSRDDDVPSASSSFTSSTYTNNSVSEDGFNFIPSFPSTPPQKSSSFSKEAATTTTENPDKLVSESPTVILVTENSPNNPTNRNRSHRVLCGSKVFGKQELPKHFAILTISLIPAVMVLHFTSHGHLTSGMTVVVVCLLSTGSVVLWIANLTKEDYPVHSHRIQMLGFVVSWAGIQGLISFFVWPHPYVALPIAFWVVLAVIHGIMSFADDHPT